MSKRIYTKEEQAALLENIHVASCSERSITFTAAFKRQAVRAYREDGAGPQHIFLTAGIPPAVIGQDMPKTCLHRWLQKDANALGQDGRGKHGKAGRKPAEHTNLDAMTKDEKIAYLKAQIAYTSAENAFLAKTRGMKRWAPFEYRPEGDTS